MAATRPTDGSRPDITVTTNSTATFIEQQWRDVVANGVDKSFPASLNLEDGHCADSA